MIEKQSMSAKRFAVTLKEYRSCEAMAIDVLALRDKISNVVEEGYEKYFCRFESVVVSQSRMLDESNQEIIGDKAVWGKPEKDNTSTLISSLTSFAEDLTKLLGSVEVSVGYCNFSIYNRRECPPIEFEHDFEFILVAEETAIKAKGGDERDIKNPPVPNEAQKRWIRIQEEQKNAWQRSRERSSDRFVWQGH